MGFDGPFGDGQSQAVAAGVAGMMKWLEDLRQQLGGNAWPCVFNGDEVCIRRLFEPDADLGATGGVLQRVADQIIEGSPQQLSVAGQQALLLAGDLQEQRVILILEANILDQTLQQGDQIQIIFLRLGDSRLQARQRQHLADHLVEAHGFVLQSLQHLRQPLRVLADQTDGHLQAGQGGAQIVGDVVQ